MGIEHDTVIIYDRGYHVSLAKDIAKEAAKVLHYTPILGQQPTSRDDMIGSGIEGVEKIDDFEAHKDKADLIIFPGEYDGEVCDRMWKEGRRAFGSGMSAEIEIDRILFLDICEEIGLKPIKTYIAEGFDDAVSYFTEQEKIGNLPLWVKTPYTRGDFDTIKFESLATFMPWINFMKAKVGVGASANYVFLIQNNFEALVESGADRYIVNGKRTPKGFIGYEVKDKGYIYKVVDKVPDILDDIDRRLEPEFTKRGYKGAWSTEARINKKKTKFTDGTARFGSPPFQGFSASYTKLGQDIEDVANGIMPKMESNDSHGAIIILTSWFNQENEICVEFPKEFDDNIKLQHSYFHEGHWYCLPNDAKDGYFGAVVATGNSVKDCTEKAKEIAQTIKCIGLEYDESVFDKTQDKIEAGKEFGIEV